MTSTVHGAVGGVVSMILAMGLVGCSDDGDLQIVNDGPADVTVTTGDHQVVVDADGGVVLLEYGCTPGDVTVVFASGPDVVLPGPVCPDRRIMVGDGTAALHAAP